MTYSNEATDKQLEFIRSLLSQKEVDDLLAVSIKTTLNDALPPSKPWAHNTIELLLSKRSKVKAPSPQTQPFPEVPAGFYAVTWTDQDEDVTKFYKVDRPDKGRWIGYTFLSIQASEEFWPIKDPAAKAAVMKEIAKDPTTAQQLYGQKIGRCGVCNLTLTDEESRRIGIGPVCRSK